MNEQTIAQLRAVRASISKQIADLNGISNNVDCDDGINDAITHLDDALDAVEGALRDCGDVLPDDGDL